MPLPPQLSEHSHGIDKVLVFDGRDDAGLRMREINLDSRASQDELTKFASSMHPEVRAFVDAWEPREGFSCWLIDALGSDSYGNNINGDRFPAEMLAHAGPDYGHKTFERFGYPFFHHINKDPKYAYGPKVPLAVWQERMQRVQVVAWWDHELTGDLMERLIDGEVIDVSMGCRVPFDECTVCGNRARKRSQYCEHLRREMNQLHPNGVRVGAINWFPKFFDISRVIRGADKCSKFLIPIGVSFRRGRILKTATIDAPLTTTGSADLFQKVAAAVGAEVSDELPELEAKTADEKVAEIEKEVPSNLMPIAEGACEAMGKLRRMEPDLPSDLLDRLVGGHGLKSTLATMLGLGVVPKPHEFQRLVLVSMGRKDDADRFEAAGQCFNEADDPGDGELDGLVGGPGDLSPEVGQELAPHLPMRSCIKPMLGGRAMLIIKAAAAGPLDLASLQEREREPLPLAPLAIGLAALHGAFKQHASSGGMAALGSAAARNPGLLALLTALGVGAMEAHRAVALTNAHPFQKEANIGFGARFLGLPAATYIYSDIQEAKRRRGEHLTRMQDFIRANPDLASIGAVFAAPGAARALKGLGGLMKVNGLVSEIGTNIPLYALFSRSGPALPLAATGAALDVAIFQGLGRLMGSPNEGRR